MAFNTVAHCGVPLNAATALAASDALEPLEEPVVTALPVVPSAGLAVEEGAVVEGVVVGVVGVVDCDWACRRLFRMSWALYTTEDEEPPPMLEISDESLDRLTASPTMFFSPEGPDAAGV